MKDTKIEWADDTVNPWWGCERISPACQHCYAETLAARFHAGLWGPGSDRRLRLYKAIGELESIARKGEREGRPRRVFIASMADVFEDRADLIEPRKCLWDALHRLDGRLIPMLLTKRPAVMAAWAKEHGWPAGAWAGTTVEDQRRADERIPELLRVPARVRFLSMEPLLEAVEIKPIAVRESHTGGGQWTGIYDPMTGRVTGYGYGCVDWKGHPSHGDYYDVDIDHVDARVDWIIVGGESGPKARPMHPAWARSLRDQAQAAGVAFHFKQWGEWAPGEDVEANRTDWPGMYERSREDGGAPRHSWPDAEIRETAKRLGRDVPTGPIDMDTTVLRVGKHAAGRLLDGRTWDEVPDVG